MKIIHILNRSLGLRDARDIITFRTCNALADRGHDVYLLTGRGQVNWDSGYGIKKSPSLSVVQLPIFDQRFAGIRMCLNSVFNGHVRKQLIHLCDDGECIVHSRERYLMGELLALRSTLGAKLVYDAHEVHSLFGSKKRRDENFRVESHVIGAVDGITAGSTALADKLREVYGPNRHIDVVPFAAPFAPGEYAGRDRRDSIFRLYYVGKFSVERGMTDVINAVSLTPGCELHVLGGDDKSIEFFRGYASNAGVADRVSFHGFVNPSDLGKALRDTDAFVVSPRAVGQLQFGFPTKIFDCMAGGRPIISTRLPSVMDVLKDNVNSVLIEPGSPEDISRAIKRLMGDPELADRLGKQALEDAREYTYENRAEKLERVFRRVLG